MREFVVGVGMLGRGFAQWRRHPGVMAWGLVPAAIVGVVFFAGLITLAAFLPSVAEALTPFADGWAPVWVTIARITAGTAVFGAALALVAVSFTALSLTIGDPFYERVWRVVEADHGDTEFDAEYGFWRAVRDGAGLIVRGVLVALLAAVLGFIPVVGSVVGGTIGVLLTGWILADELTSRALTARGIDRRTRRTMRRARRGRVLGFGVATQLCFLVPLGAIVTMPAAVAGATLLARSLPDAGVTGAAAHASGQHDR
ncbi:EI24 domain-containing protein [Microbacterium koreense]|uniref:EI24 domain-containing protein n=1 Tax=Microbacterium koreense TaxID=323761 RepID=A0ABW2ZR39_9MICO